MAGGTVTVAATDAAGNTTNKTCDISSAAAIVVTGGPRGPMNDANAKYTFELEKDAIKQSAKPECSYDGGAFGACTTDKTYVVSEPVVGKVHTFTVRAKTPAGKVLGSDKASFERDPIAMCLDGEKQLGKADLSALLDTATTSSIDLWYRSHVAMPVFDLFGLTAGTSSLALRYDEAAGLEVTIVHGKTSTQTFALPTGFAVAQWHHFSIASSGKELAVFVDGSKLTLTSTKLTGLPTLAQLVAGSSHDVAFELAGPGAYLDLKIGSTARSAAFAPTFPAMVDKTTTALFPMSEAKGTTSIDLRDSAPDLQWSAPETQWSTCLSTR